MTIQYPYSKNPIFRDITKERSDVVQAVANTSKGINVKVFEFKGTCIIYSHYNETQHASLSNESRPVEEWEVGFAIAKILKVKTRDTNIFVTENNVVHIHHEKDNTLTN